MRNIYELLSMCFWLFLMWFGSGILFLMPIIVVYGFWLYLTKQRTPWDNVQTDEDTTLVQGEYKATTVSYKERPDGQVNILLNVVDKNGHENLVKGIMYGQRSEVKDNESVK